MEVVNAFVLSFGRGLELLILVGGNSLSPLLSSQVRVPRAVQIRRGGVRVLTEEEDAVLRYAVSRIGRKCSGLPTVARILAGRGACELKQHHTLDGRRGIWRWKSLPSEFECPDPQVRGWLPWRGQGRGSCGG